VLRAVLRAAIILSFCSVYLQSHMLHPTALLYCTVGLNKDSLIIDWLKL